MTFQQANKYKTSQEVMDNWWPQYEPILMEYPKPLSQEVENWLYINWLMVWWNWLSKRGGMNGACLSRFVRLV